MQSIIPHLCLILLFTCCTLGIFAQDASSSRDRVLTGPNVCLKQEATTVTTMEPTREATQVATKTWCLAFPPRCTTYKTVFKLVYKPKSTPKTEMVRACCEGYITHSNGTCVPRCTNPCINGQCMAPEKCACNDGFAGDTCTQKCPADKWGPQCLKECKCQNGGTCDPVTGKCQCADGYQGENCESLCPPGQFGYKCLQACRCQNGSLCDNVSGACKCQPGTCGPLCQYACGLDATRTCDKCQNGARCLSETDDKCTCSAGWMGDVCANPCDDGFWGNNCSKTCKICYNRGKCDPVNGNCKCPPGYYGPQCEMQCQPMKYGQNCESECSCAHAQTCDPANGQCHCERGYKGDRCDIRGCPDGLFGEYCNKTCTCSNMTSCHPVDGTCQCKLGWRNTQGNTCTMCCILNNGGPECFKDCGASSMKYLCGPELDGCVCLNDYTGPECRVLGLDINNAALHSTGSLTKSDNTGLIAGLCVTVIVIILILALALFYRRRIRKLQNELAYVTQGSSIGTDSDSSDSKSDLAHADNMLYMGGGGMPVGKAATTVIMKNGETFVKVSEPLPKKPVQNTYVSMPNQAFDDRESIYQSIEYETPLPRHQYASIEEARPVAGVTNQAFENQLYNQNGNGKPRVAPPSYESVITESHTASRPSTTD